MNKQPDHHVRNGSQSQPPDDAYESACFRFEQAWQGGQPLLAEEFLKQVDIADPENLLVDLLCIEIESRRRGGEDYGRDELRLRFPERSSQWHDSVFTRLRTEDQVLFIGERLGRYRVEASEAKGAFGNVYRARDELLDRPVAIKVARHGCCDALVYDQLHRESKILAAMCHPGIVPVFDFGRLDSGAPYVVLEYMSGKSLARRIADGAVSWRQAVEWIAAVADAVHYMHSRGVVHRDLKPANIVLDDRDQPRVTDFGLAFQEHVSGEAEVFAGTPCYMAPEQVAPDQYAASPASDIWAIGAILYELLTGQRPFTIPQLQEMAASGSGACWTLPSHFDPAIPTRLDRVCAKCLAVKPADRFSSAGHLVRELQGCLDEPRWSRRRAILAASAGAVLVTGAAWSVLHQQSVRPLNARIRVLAWNASDGLRWLDQPHALPLRSGDAVRVHVEFGEPAFAFIAWIDAAARAVPLFPAREGHWDWLPSQQKAESVSLPSDSSRGWEMVVEQPGLETVLVCARKRPAQEEHLLQLRQALDAWEPQPVTMNPVLLEFHRGRVQASRAELTRKPQISSATPLDHALFRNQRMLQNRLSGHFEEIAAITFTCQ